MRVVIADDQLLIRDSLKTLLETRNHEVVGLAGNGKEAVSMAHELRPDLVLMDLVMPEMDGLKATQLISSQLEDVKVVILTGSTKDGHFFDAIKAGAEGYLFKNIDAERFFHLIDGISRGEQPALPLPSTDPLVTPLDVKQVEPRHDPDALTARERQVLRAMVDGVTTNRALAGHLGVSENTVKFHVRNILDKFDLNNRAQAVSYAVRHGLVEASMIRPRSS